MTMPSAATDPARGVEIRKRQILKASPLHAATPVSLNTLVGVGELLRVENGRSLLCEGEPAAAVAILGTGRVRLSRMLEGAGKLALGYRGVGDVVGESALGAAHRTETAIAMEHVEALMVPAEALRALGAADQALGSSLLQVLLARQRETEERVASLLIRSVEGRVCDFLVRAAARWGVPEPRGVLIAAHFTHQELADLLGSTRETLTLTLGELRREGLIDVDLRRIVLRDRAALATRAARSIARSTPAREPR
jgi:CRP/FNR family transcriptional regulator, cyclic AMP receptor protein